MITLTVVFTEDPTGMSPDIKTEISLPEEVCLFCCHDARLKVNRWEKVVCEALKYKGFDVDFYSFSLLKVYTT